MYTDEKIQERAKRIGNRPYHSIAINDGYEETHYGISIRQELMRTAMGAMCSNIVVIMPNGDHVQLTGGLVCEMVSDITNALLIQMAKDELGVKE